jgi:hypothetical protein
MLQLLSENCVTWYIVKFCARKRAGKQRSFAGAGEDKGTECTQLNYEKAANCSLNLISRGEQQRKTSGSQVSQGKNQPYPKNQLIYLWRYGRVNYPELYA